MTAAVLLALVALGSGTALALDTLPWFRRGSLAARLRRYAPPATAGVARDRPGSAVGAVLGPSVRQLGDRLGRLGGRGPELRRRLVRAGAPPDPARFRLRQVVHAVAGLGIGATLAILLRPGGVVGAVLVVGVPLLWVMVDEQQLSSAGARRAARIQLELPVVAEQLAILVGAGHSLPSAVTRIGRRGRGAVAVDLDLVGRRIRQGVDDAGALREWSERVDVPSVRRLVDVLGLHRDAGDLGRLIADESRAIRAETHRQLVESIERRSQLVWIPVTVATLVPGLLFLAVPFISAINQVTGGP
jgi:Flp pilus assembly protein TadB